MQCLLFNILKAFCLPNREEMLKDSKGKEFIIFVAVFHGSAERRRLELERPFENESEAVNLKFGLTLQQIMDV